MVMRHVRLAAVLVLALLLAAQLTLHHHSLIPEAGSAAPPVCSVCVSGADPGSLLAPLLATILVVLGIVAIPRHRPVAIVVSLATAGRAPPLG